MKSHTSRKKRSLARLLLIAETLIIAVFFVLFFKEYLSMRRIDPIYANSYYPTLAEYLVGSLIIALASAALVDRLEHSDQTSS